MFMPSILLTNSIAAASNPWYGFRLRPQRTPNTGSPQKSLTFVRNIFYVKCHELYLARMQEAGRTGRRIVESRQSPIGNRPQSASLPYSQTAGGTSADAARLGACATVIGRLKIGPAILALLVLAMPVAAQQTKNRTPRPGAPESNWVNINADHQTQEGHIYHLRGSARVETTDELVTADEIDYDDDTGNAQARGHVHFENFANGDKIDCDHGEYNYNSSTGRFFLVRGTSPAKVQTRPGILTTSNPFYFEGQWAERLEDRYVLHDGYITDCKMPNPWWRLTGPKFDIIPGDRALAYRAVFRIRSIPLFYAPVLYKSLKRLPRKSGFLTPNIGNSSIGGKMIGAGYYWAINRSYDMSYRGLLYTQRGLAHDFGFRGKVTPGTDFSVTLYGVNDTGLKQNGQIIQ